MPCHTIKVIYLEPLFQNESSCKTNRMETSVTWTTLNKLVYERFRAKTRFETDP